MEKLPFYMDGMFREYETGDEFFDSRKFAGPYEGLCYVGPDIFRTWVDCDKQRHWKPWQPEGYRDVWGTWKNP